MERRSPPRRRTSPSRSPKRLRTPTFTTFTSTLTSPVDRLTKQELIQSIIQFMNHVYPDQDNESYREILLFTKKPVLRNLYRRWFTLSQSLMGQSSGQI